MTKQNKYQLRLPAVLVLIIVAMCIPANSATSASNNMLDMLPADTLFAVKANNLDYALGRLDQFLAGASPIPMGASMMLRMQLGQMFGSPELAGINTAGNFTIFGKTSGIAPQPGQAPPMFLAVAVPVTDYKTFIDGNPNCSPADTRKISKLTTKNKSMIQAGQFALICISGTDDQLIETAKKLLSAKEAKLVSILDKTAKQDAAKEPFWAYCNMELINKNFGTVISSKFQESKSMMLMMADQNPQMKNSAAMMDVYFEAFNCIMGSSKSISATLSPSPETLKAQMIASALPDTLLAEMFQTNTAPKEKFAHYLNDGAMMNLICNLNPVMTKAINDFGYKAMMTMSPSDPNSAETKTIMNSFIENASGSMAVSIMPASKPGQFVTVATITKIKDAEKMQKDMDTMIAIFKKGMFNSPGMNMDIQLDKNTSKYKNTNINSLKYTLKAQDPNSPEAQIIGAMFADGLDAKYAIVNNLTLYALGGDNTATINQLIDKTKSPSLTTSEELKKALSLIPGSENADIFATYNILRVMKIFMSFIPTPTPQIPDIPTTSNIVFTAKADNGKMKLDVAVPKEHVKEIMTLVQTMQMQQMQQAQPTPATPNDPNQQ
ncbi:MAG: hypothetical protein KAS96_08335 [Planctomycetes bacterium]|nr:hypothetical protein [Planctomycetota bacterium]